MPGLYLHIPYCRKACSYCDFHFSTRQDSRSRMIDAMLRELALRKDYLKINTLSSVYFGGGTPSLLGPAEISSLMSGVLRCFSLEQGAEVTLEANPDDISAENVRVWKDIGINRLSIGLQSFDDEELKWMNRAHTAAQSLQAVTIARDAGIGSLSIDLIYGSKFQSPESWKKTLRIALDLGVQHLSAYNLTLEKRTKLGLLQQRGAEPEVSESLSAEQFLLMQEMLLAGGFEHYEISNFAKPGYRAVHNSNYWRQSEYLGIGPSAHSFNGTSRQWNVRNNETYIRNLAGGQPFSETEELSERERFNEMVMTGLRTSWGCDPATIGQLLGPEFRQSFLEKARTKKEHFLVTEAGAYVLKPASRLLADGIASDFFLV